ncbi:MAG TPA: DNA helicase RecQ [Opitutales bacterium]|nr:DNA helicase RecQ [Opitutales bacterium]
MVTTLLAPLKSVFGYDAFRPLQQEIMEASLAGRDVLAILPTGGGKSLCYQLPALQREGLTVVVSPLIALMKDQVDQLQAAGVAATFLNSSLAGGEARARLSGLERGEYKLLYLAPERLFLPDFLEKLKRWQVAALAIDEAHCISEWGHDFRPEYRQLATLREHFPGVPVTALTATATERVQKDIVTQLQLTEPGQFVASFNRPNLTYRVMPKQRPRRQVLDYVAANRDASGIVYCQSRRAVEDYALTLQEAGHKALPYHAGLPQSERIANQEAFIRDDAQVICATIAFGMGINKPNVRFVLHADLPKNVESYYQETGRAGRDGLPAECVLLFSGGDIAKYSHFIDQMEDEQAARIARQQLRQMADFAEYVDCRRGALLRYFGETYGQDNCQSCDNCLDDRAEVDVTVECQKLLSCIFRINQAGYPMGLNHAVDVLRGSENMKVMAKGHQRLSTHGIGRDQAAEYWQGLGKQLIQRGFLKLSDDGYGTVELTGEARRALKTRREIRMKPIQTKVAAAARNKAKSGAIECDEGLFEVLRKLRKDLADARGVPPYVVFGDVALRQMARRYPRDEAAFLSIPGVGQQKLREYGDQFIEVIDEWLLENDPRDFEPNGFLDPAPKMRKSKDPEGLNPTSRTTLELFQQGKDVDTIAAERNLNATTIEAHLANCVEAGKLANLDGLVDEAEFERIRGALAEHGTAGLRPIYEALDEEVSYGKIRLAVAKLEREEKVAAAR